MGLSLQKRRRASNGLAAWIYTRKHSRELYRGEAVRLSGGGAVDSATNAARGIVFVNTWAAVTAKSGMRDLAKTAQKLRLKNLVVKNKIDALIDDEQR